MADPELEKELRRQQSTLRSLGSGVIAFGLWEAIKPLLIIILAPDEEIKASMANLTVPQMLFVVLIVAVILLLAMSFRFWMGLSARAEGLGKRRGPLYMVVAFIAFGVQTILFVMALWVLPTRNFTEEPLLSALASLVVEGTSVCITGELAFAARKVKRLKKQLGEA